jgi:hypothetical protein
MNPELTRTCSDPYRVVTTAYGSFVICLQHSVTNEAVTRSEAYALANALNTDYQKRMAL